MKSVCEENGIRNVEKEQGGERNGAPKVFMLTPTKNHEILAPLGTSY